MSRLPTPKTPRTSLVALDYTGTSMHPLLQPGAKLLCRAGGRPRVGDIVLLQSGDTLVAHRLLGWRHSPHGTLMLLAGDNRPGPDPPVAAEGCLGTVCEVVAGRRRLLCQRPLVRAGFRLLAAVMRRCLQDAPSASERHDSAQGGALPVRVLAHLLRVVLWGLAHRAGATGEQAGS